MKAKRIFKEYIYKSINAFPPIKVIFSGKHLYELQFLKELPVNSFKEKLTEEEKRLLSNLKKDLRKFFLGGRVNFRKYSIKFFKGTDFQKKVWKAIKTVPYGQTHSYKWLAEKIGNIKSFRAVGTACGKNPLPIIIPCHRIISLNGSLGGYSAGVDLKMQLLHIEKVSERNRI